MQKIVVTGINGFVGKHLTRELVSHGVRVVGISRDADAHPEISSQLSEYYACDLADANDVKALDLTDVDAIINLAGLANVGDSFNKPDLYKQVNVAVLSNLGDLVSSKGLSTRIIAVSSGALYDPNQPMPLTEESKTMSNSPYAESKLLMEEAAKNLRDKGIDCIVARPFNHTGPGQAPGFLIPDLHTKLSQNSHALLTGNLNTRRDYTDVRDIAHAYYLLATSDDAKQSIYNICSGQSRSGQEVLDTLLGVMGISGDRLEISVDQNLVRPSDPIELFGSHDLLTRDTRWQPHIPFEDTIKDFVSQQPSNN